MSFCALLFSFNSILRKCSTLAHKFIYLTVVLHCIIMSPLMEMRLFPEFCYDKQWYKLLSPCTCPTYRKKFLKVKFPVEKVHALLILKDISQPPLRGCTIWEWLFPQILDNHMQTLLLASMRKEKSPVFNLPFLMRRKAENSLLCANFMKYTHPF